MPPPIEGLPDQISLGTDWFRLQYAGDALLGVMFISPLAGPSRACAPPIPATVRHDHRRARHIRLPHPLPYASGRAPLIFRPLSP